jgi:hypothetical protein
MDMIFFGDVIVYRYRYDLDHIFWLLMAAPDMPWSRSQQLVVFQGFLWGRSWDNVSDKSKAEILGMYQVASDMEYDGKMMGISSLKMGYESYPAWLCQTLCELFNMAQSK